MNDQEKLNDILRDFANGMLVSRDPRGAPRARPMSLARVDDDNAIWFVTSKASGKLDELEGDARVAVTLQGATKFVSVTGRAAVVNDRATIEELWQESWSIWFENGRRDPDLTLLKITPERGEYWDVSGRKGLRFVWEAAKAYATGGTIEEAGEHGKVPAARP